MTKSPESLLNTRKILHDEQNNIITIKMNETKFRSNSSTKSHIPKQNEEHTDSFNMAIYIPNLNEKKEPDLQDNSIETIPLPDDKSVFDQSFNDYFPELIKPKKKSSMKIEDNLQEIRATNKFSSDNVFLRLKEEIYKAVSSSDKRKKFEDLLNKSLNLPIITEMIHRVEIKIDVNDDFFIGTKHNNKLLKGVMYYSTGDYYEGEFINNRRDGQGIFVYKNGTKYEGMFKTNRQHGYGKLTQLDGEVYIGQWTEGRINGHGVRYHLNGDKYSGQYINNVRSGMGNYVFANGDYYDGMWINGKANGKGRFIYSNGNSYEGEFVDNQIAGKGTFNFANGDIFKGIFRNGLLHGQGLHKNSKGETYQGEFREGKRNGYGNFYNSEGQLISSGYWLNDQYVGKRPSNGA